MPQTSGFRSAKEILVVSFATQLRAFILSDRNIFYTPGGVGRTTAGLMPLGLFLFFIITPPSERGLVIPIFYSAVRTGLVIPIFFRGFFFTPPSGRGLVIPILFPWFFTSPSGRGLVIPFFFSVVFFLVVTCPRPSLGQNNTCGNFRSFRVYSPEFS